MPALDIDHAAMADLKVNVFKKPEQLSDAEAGKILRGAKYGGPQTMQHPAFLYLKEQVGKNLVVSVPVFSQSIGDLELAEQALVTRKPHQDFEQDETDARHAFYGAAFRTVASGAVAVGLAAVSYKVADDITDKIRTAKESKPQQQSVVPTVEYVGEGICLIGSFVLGAVAAFAYKHAKKLKDNLRDVVRKTDEKRDATLELVRSNLSRQRILRDEWKGYDSGRLIN